MSGPLGNAWLKVAEKLEAGGPGSGPQGGSGSVKSYPTKAQSDRAVAKATKDIADARQALDTAMARDIESDPLIKSLRQQSSALDQQKAAIMQRAEAKKAAIAQKYAAKKAAADADFQRKMKEAGL